MSNLIELPLEQQLLTLLCVSWNDTEIIRMHPDGWEQLAKAILQNLNFVQPDGEFTPLGFAALEGRYDNPQDGSKESLDTPKKFSSSVVTLHGLLQFCMTQEEVPPMEHIATWSESELEDVGRWANRLLINPQANIPLPTVLCRLWD